MFYCCAFITSSLLCKQLACSPPTGLLGLMGLFTQNRTLLTWEQCSLPQLFTTIIIIIIIRWWRSCCGKYVINVISNLTACASSPFALLGFKASDWFILVPVRNRTNGMQSHVFEGRRSGKKRLCGVFGWMRPQGKATVLFYPTPSGSCSWKYGRLGIPKRIDSHQNRDSCSRFWIVQSFKISKNWYFKDLKILLLLSEKDIKSFASSVSFHLIKQSFRLFSGLWMKWVN